MSAIAVDGSNSFLQNYRDAISKLEADPNATASYKSGLENEFQAVKDQFQKNSGPSASPPQIIVDDSIDGGKHHDAPPAYTDDPPSYTAVAPVSKAVVPSSTGTGTNLPDGLKQLEPVIKQAADATGESVDELEALTWDESRAKIGATSVNGGTGLTDGGLTQQDPATFAAEQAKHPELQGKSIDDPLANEEAAGFELKEFDQKYHNIDLDQRAYNSGEDSVDLSNPDITTTGLGDPAYNKKVDAERYDIDNGIALPA